MRKLEIAHRRPWHDTLFATGQFGVSLGLESCEARRRAGQKGTAESAAGRCQAGPGVKGGGKTHLSCRPSPTANQLQSRRRSAGLVLCGTPEQHFRREHASPAFSAAGGQPRPRREHWAWADAPGSWPIDVVHPIANSVTTYLMHSLRNTAAKGRLSARQTRRARVIGLGCEAHLETLANQPAISSGVRPADSATDAQLEPHASPGDCDRR